MYCSFTWVELKSIYKNEILRPAVKINYLNKLGKLKVLELSLSKNDLILRMQTNKTRYPSGMAVLGEYLHINGLKFGLYSDAGYRTCGGMAASLGYEAIDLDQGSIVHIKLPSNSQI